MVAYVSVKSTVLEYITIQKKSSVVSLQLDCIIGPFILSVGARGGRVL